jgi:hypothetical protein
VGDNRLAVPLAFDPLCDPPLALILQIPFIVFEDRFARLGVRKNLDPAFDSKQAGNPTQQKRLL